VGGRGRFGGEKGRPAAGKAVHGALHGRGKDVWEARAVRSRSA
jgi:hypothetical protein